jgi:antirestriction protein ArdC
MLSMPATRKPKAKRPARRRSNAERFDVYAHVTERVTTALDQGVTAWRKPWTNVGGLEGVLPSNAVTGREYKGINVVLLYITSAIEGYSDPRWLTFKQAAKRARAVWLKANGHKDNEAGEAAYVQAVKDGYRGGVRKGEHSTIVTLWKPFEVDVDDPKHPGQKKKENRFMLRHYYVFNVEQCDGLDLKTMAPVAHPLTDAEAAGEFSPIKAAESVIAGMPNRPALSHGGNRAFYRPATDSIRLPEPGQFDSPESYYATSFHEHIHATGHDSRTGRVKDWTSFGSEPYAQEELVAEMGAAFLCGMVGIDSGLDQSAAYIADWSQKIKEATAADKRWLVNAAARAQKAADYVLAVPAYSPEPVNGEAA